MILRPLFGNTNPLIKPIRTDDDKRLEIIEKQLKRLEFSEIERHIDLHNQEKFKNIEERIRKLELLELSNNIRNLNLQVTQLKADIMDKEKQKDEGKIRVIKQFLSEYCEFADDYRIPVNDFNTELCKYFLLIGEPIRRSSITALMRKHFPQYKYYNGHYDSKGCYLYSGIKFKE